jgi:hypothetical protein
LVFTDTNFDSSSAVMDIISFCGVSDYSGHLFGDTTSLSIYFATIQENISNVEIITSMIPRHTSQSDSVPSSLSSLPGSSSCSLYMGGYSSNQGVFRGSYTV